MAARKPAPGVRKGAPKRSTREVARPTAARVTVGRAAMEEARCAGLLDGEKTRFTFQAPKALVEAAMRESGATTRAELGTLALALLVQRDPVAEFLKKTRGALGADHNLDY